MLFQSAVCLVKSGKLVLVAFGIGFLSDFPADFDILVMDCFMLFTISDSVLNGCDSFHAVSGCLHIFTNGSSLFTHPLQGNVQIFQREKLMPL